MSVVTKRLVGCYDVDGPLIESNEHRFFEYAVKELGLPWRYDVMGLTGNWDLATGCDQPTRTKLYHLFRKRYNARHAEPLDRITAGAATFFASRNGHQRCLATARNPVTAQETLATLEASLGPFPLHQWGLEDKCTALQQFCPDWYVEDNLHVAVKAAALGIRTFLFPCRNIRRHRIPHGPIVLQAEKMVRPSMADEEWRAVSEKAWQEIGQHLDGLS